MIVEIKRVIDVPPSIVELETVVDVAAPSGHWRPGASKLMSPSQRIFWILSAGRLANRKIHRGFGADMA